MICFNNRMGNGRMGNGLHIRFNNGWTISIQQHDGSYATEDQTVEIAAWDVFGNWHKFEHGDNVLGHVNSDDLVKWINHFSSLWRYRPRTCQFGRSS